MWGEDDENKKAKRVNLFKPGEPDRPKPTPNLDSQDSVFKNYCEISETFREGCGVKMEKGQVIVTDKKRLDALSDKRKEILREVCRDLRDEYLNSTKFWKEQPE